MSDLLPLVLIALAGGGLPLLVRWSDRGLHTALALATGIFLGAVFLHFLPALSTVERASPAAPSVTHLGQAHDGNTGLWLFVLAGVLGVYFVEALVLRTHDHDDLHRHKAVGIAALLGLSVHALTAGIGYAAASRDEAVSAAILMAILVHKGVETFSLTTVFQLAGFSRARILATVAAFALVTPLGILLGDGLKSVLGEGGLTAFTALAAGTFLYVCLCELLVEVFHRREDSLLKIGLLGVGIGLMALFEGIGHG